MMKYGEKSMETILEKEPKSWHFQKGTFFSDHPLLAKKSTFVNLHLVHIWKG